MRLNRLSDVQVYKQMPLRTRTQLEQQRIAQRELLRDAMLLAYGFTFVLFLFWVVG
jgi:hypothetical protein